MKAAYKTGELDPNSLIGFATITEYVVMDVLGDATKEKFCSSYDLISKSLGKINVKYSILHSGYPKRHYWIFSKNVSAKIPDYYMCLGMDEHQTEIIRVWKIPGNSKIVRKKGIFISPRGEDRVKQYAIDPLVYDTTFQGLDIQTLPEFRNTKKPKVSETRYESKRWDKLMGIGFI